MNNRTEPRSRIAECHIGNTFDHVVPLRKSSQGLGARHRTPHSSEGPHKAQAAPCKSAEESLRKRVRVAHSSEQCRRTLCAAHPTTG